MWQEHEAGDPSLVCEVKEKLLEEITQKLRPESTKEDAEKGANPPIRLPQEPLWGVSPI